MGTAGIDGDLGWDQYRNRRHQNEGSRIDYVMVAGRSNGGLRGFGNDPLMCGKLSRIDLQMA